MRQVMRYTAVLLALGVAACGDEPESALTALEREARDACTGLGSAEAACDCFIGGVLETLTEEDAETFMRMFTAEDGQAIEAIGEDPMAATLILTRLMTAVVPVAAQCEVDLDLGIQ